jgi:hypothetical protein
MMFGDQFVPSAARQAPLRAARFRLEPVHSSITARPTLEAFIAARFKLTYGARVTHFLPHLIGVRDNLAGWQAGAGYAAAARQTLFLERYLDRPVERAISAALGQPVARSGIVEVGNLATASSGMARTLIPELARHLHRLGYAWVTFTATRALRNSFRRLGLQPIKLAAADPARLEDGGASWGTYYAQDPVVVACEISQGLRAWGYA